MRATLPAAQVTYSSLSDGRDLIYYDAPGSPERTPSPDIRPPESRPDTARMRFDVLTGQWISIATNRQNRAFLPPADADPLAPQTAHNPSEVPDAYQVAVFENRSPSFGPALPDQALPDPTLPDPSRPDDDRLNAAVPGDARLFGIEATSGGRCEVVCFSPERTGSYATQTTRRARTIVEAWAHRTAELSALPGAAQVFPFENRGVAIGVTLHHPHGQIYSYPYVPDAIRTVCRAVDRHGPDLFARLLEFEAAGPRVVLSGEHFTAFVPFAARWPVELHVMPHRHVPDLAATTAAERDELAVISLRLTRALDRLYDAPLPYIGAWFQAPVHSYRDSVRLHWRLTSPQRTADKLKFLAGSESGMGAWVSDVSPEDVAARLREALAKADTASPAEPLDATRHPDATRHGECRP